MEVTQFTYFQQCGGIDCDPVCGEITYGLERLAMFIQNKENVYDIDWIGDVKYGDVFHHNEVEYSKYNFEFSDATMLATLLICTKRKQNTCSNVASCSQLTTTR